MQDYSLDVVTGLAISLKDGPPSLASFTIINRQKTPVF